MKFPTLCAIVLAIAAGCSSTVREYSRPAGRKVEFQPKVITHSEIQINSGPDARSFGELEDKVKDARAYIMFRRKYSAYSTTIIQCLRDKRFREVNNQVMRLVNLLENDPNPYAKKYLAKVKSFSYEIYEISEVVNEVRSTDRKKARPMGTLMTAPVTLAFDVMSILLPGSHRTGDRDATGPGYLKEHIEIGFPQKVDTHVTASTFNHIRVNPYTNNRFIMERNVPYHELERRLRGYQ